MMVSSVIDVTLNGLKVLSSKFVKGMLAMRADSVVCTSGLSNNNMLYWVKLQRARTCYVKLFAYSEAEVS